MKRCSFDGCSRAYYAKGHCEAHYQQARSGKLPRPVLDAGLTAIERFVRKIELAPGGCWLWQGATSPDGYGHFRAHGHVWLAHRYSIHAFENVYLPPHKYVCHRCDTPGCVRPSHLFVGTSSENARDRNAKGRGGHSPNRILIHKEAAP